MFIIADPCRRGRGHRVAVGMHASAHLQLFRHSPSERRPGMPPFAYSAIPGGSIAEGTGSRVRPFLNRGLPSMKPTTTTPEQVPIKTVVPVPVDRLVLDYRNPRLIHLEETAADEDIIAQLYRAEDLGELLQSIASNGYLDIEPLIVLAEGDRLVVLEGNRRLAAIRLLREPKLASRVGERSGIRIALPIFPIPTNILLRMFQSIECQA